LCSPQYDCDDSKQNKRELRPIESLAYVFDGIPKSMEGWNRVPEFN